ncbi:hypothetical protein [Veillonella criceti]|uniref:Uncharacterized protein n=1 Tax=Veillonella criceti TaxID=103891 RepID=A0A380NGX0_9FIRM|nr:hypothetical protein [Veillonella criceti]SUP40382.1 Uncharacterised protein [Veillonella criceti]
MSCTHNKKEIPTNPQERARYDWAKKQTEVAKAQGMDSAELHALFKYIMELDVEAVSQSGTEEVHAVFRRALGQATTALEAGQPEAVALNLFRCIMHGDLKN